MVTEAEIGWGSYKLYEGPFYRGKHPYKLPHRGLTTEERIVAVITATEGGHFDAYNGYDRCICTSGLIQWCEASQFSVSDMLGQVYEDYPFLLKPIREVAFDAGLEFKKNEKGRWRFFFQDSRGEVDRLEEQQQMFLADSTGKKGTWDETSKQYAKKWAAAISTVWEDPSAQRVQLRYTSRRLYGFMLPFSKGYLEDLYPSDAGVTYEETKALTAAYLSFAANNPTWADQALRHAVQNLKGKTGSAIVIEILKQLTFYKGISIYPHRYNAIRPVLETLYDVQLPDFADELKKWKDEQGFALVWDTKEVQEALIALGYDLGPWGADGKWGNKTTEALINFERMKYPDILDIPEEFIDGKMDVHTAKKLEAVLMQRGLENLTSKNNA